jgi:hypothetical protein
VQKGYDSVEENHAQKKQNDFGSRALQYQGAMDFGALEVVKASLGVFEQAHM